MMRLFVLSSLLLSLNGDKLFDEQTLNPDIEQSKNKLKDDLSVIDEINTIIGDPLFDMENKKDWIESVSKFESTESSGSFLITSSTSDVDQDREAQTIVGLPLTAVGIFLYFYLFGVVDIAPPPSNAPSTTSQPSVLTPKPTLAPTPFAQYKRRPLLNFVEAGLKTWNVIFKFMDKLIDPVPWPSMAPSISPYPSMAPSSSHQPSASMIPSVTPSFTHNPSAHPSIEPTMNPSSYKPSNSARPSKSPNRPR